VGQQPNVQLELENLPRREPHPGPARRRATPRPGDLAGPAQVPWGGDFGTPGPDTGFALLLAAGRPLALAPGESRADVERLVAVLMAARASRLGRAPVAGDAEVAEMILGLREGGGAGVGPAPMRGRLSGHGAEVLTRLLGAVDAGLLTAPADEVRRRWTAGERLIG